MRFSLIKEKDDALYYKEQAAQPHGLLLAFTCVPIISPFQNGEASQGPQVMCNQQAQ